jgi:hypothetical protein
MIGSRRQEFTGRTASSQQDRIYSITLAGRTYWAWERRDASGTLVRFSEQLFMDYVDCFCDSRKSTD